MAKDTDQEDYFRRLLDQASPGDGFVEAERKRGMSNRAIWSSYFAKEEY